MCLKYLPAVGFVKTFRRASSPGSLQLRSLHTPDGAAVDKVTSEDRDLPLCASNQEVSPNRARQERSAGGTDEPPDVHPVSQAVGSAEDGSGSWVRATFGRLATGR